MVLEGAIDLIDVNRPLIILETFNTKKNKERLDIFCNRFGYTKKYISADNYLLTHDRHKQIVTETQV